MSCLVFSTLLWVKTSLHYAFAWFEKFSELPFSLQVLLPGRERKYLNPAFSFKVKIAELYPAGEMI